MIRFLLLILLLVPVAFSQDGVYKSSEDLEEVVSPDSVAAYSFVYRVGEGVGQYRFYTVPMNNLLYGSKKTFQWPSELEKEKRSAMILFGSRSGYAQNQAIAEVIFNDKMVLTSTDSLFGLYHGTLVEFKKIPPPGIAWITSQEKSNYQRFDANGKAVIKELPAFYYTLTDTVQILLVRSEKRISKELNPYVPPGQFKTIVVECGDYPQIQLPARILPEPPNRVELDSAGLREVDLQIQKLRQWIQEDSARIVEFLDSVKVFVGESMARVPKENEAKYQRRLAVFQQERDSIRVYVARWNRLEQVLLPMRQRLQIFEDYRKQQEVYLANEEFKRSQDFRGGLLKHHLHKRLFGSVVWTLGRNMDKDLANPSPSYMAGGGGKLEWMDKLKARVSWGVQAGGFYHQWLYRESEKEWSREASGQAAVVLGIPLGIAPAGNYQLDTTQGLLVQAYLGPSFGYRYLSLRHDGDYEGISRGIAGGVVGLSFYFGARPFLFSIDYSYFHDGLGDLSLRFGLPIYRWGRK